MERHGCVLCQDRCHLCGIILCICSTCLLRCCFFDFLQYWRENFSANAVRGLFHLYFLDDLGGAAAFAIILGLLQVQAAMCMLITLTFPTTENASTPSLIKQLQIIIKLSQLPVSCLQEILMIPSSLGKQYCRHFHQPMLSGEMNPGEYGSPPFCWLQRPILHFYQHIVETDTTKARQLL